MRLATFFDAAVPFLRAETPVEAFVAATGPTPSPAADLSYYATLQRVHRHRQLGELFPRVRARIVARDPDAWPKLVDAYVADHMPSDRRLPFVGAAFADWLTTHGDEGPLLACVADWRWTRWRTRHAPDDVIGDGLDERLHVRAYPVDVVGWSRALRDDPLAAPPMGEVMLLCWRDPSTHAVKHRRLDLATLAVLWRRQGRTLQGPLAAIAPHDLNRAEATLCDLGALIIPVETP